MKPLRLLQPTVAVMLLLCFGCAAKFSNREWKREILKQTGSKPKVSFEFELDGATLGLTKSLASKVAGEPISFGGLEQVEVAVYLLPGGKRLDLDLVGSRGWNSLVKTSGGNGDLMILVRSKGDAVRGLVVVAQGGGHLLYGKLEGTINKDLPSDLKDVFRDTGLQGLKDRLLAISPGNDASGKDSAPPPTGTRKP